MAHTRHLPLLSLSDEQQDFIISLHAHIAQVAREAYRNRVFSDGFTQQRAIIASAILHAFGCMETEDDKPEVLEITDAAKDFAWNLFQRRVLVN